MKLKYSDFSLRTRRVTLHEPAGDTVTIHRAACDGARNLPLRPVRLTGVSVSDFVPRDVRTSLFVDQALERRKRVEDLVSEVRKRYEVDARKDAPRGRFERATESAHGAMLVPASLLEPKPRR